MNIGKLLGKIGKALIKAGVTVLKDEAGEAFAETVTKRQAKKAAKELGL